MLGVPAINVHKRMPRWFVIAACVLGTACTEPEPVAIPSARPVEGAVYGVASPSGYVAHDLLFPPGYGSGIAYDLNASSVVVGQVGSRAVKWIHTQPTLLAPYPGQLSSAAGAINASGAIVGTLHFGSLPHYRAALWTGSGLTVLPSLNQAHALDINDAGVIVGYERTAEGPTRAVKWVDQTRVDIHPPGAAESQALAINQDGDIVGVARFGQYPALAYVWPATGNAFSLPMLPNSTECRATDIGVKGVVVGQCPTSGGAFRWTAGSGMVNLGWGPQGGAEGVSDLARFVGFADSTSNIPSKIIKLAVTLRLGVLDTLPNPVPDWKNSIAIGVNKCGTVVGAYEDYPSLASRPVMWTKPACDM